MRPEIALSLDPDIDFAAAGLDRLQNCAKKK